MSESSGKEPDEPILEDFWHTKYFINMMVKYAKELEKVESPRTRHGGGALPFLSCDDQER